MNNRSSNKSTVRILTGNDERDTLLMKNLLIIAGIRQSDVARALGVRKPIVNRVILRKDNSKRVITFFENLAEHHFSKLVQITRLFVTAPPK